MNLPGWGFFAMQQLPSPADAPYVGSGLNVCRVFIRRSLLRAVMSQNYLMYQILGSAEGEGRGAKERGR
jgi:hypothetical protein